MKLKSMKWATSLALGVLLLCAAFTQISRANETRDAKIKAEMIENYLLWEIAWKNKDAERIISFESPDFTIVSGGNVVTKTEADASWRDTFKTVKKVYDAKVEIKKLTIEPNRVVVLSKQFIEADTALPNNPSYHVCLTMQVRDIWVEYDRVWMLKRSEQTHASPIVNGLVRNFTS